MKNKLLTIGICALFMNSVAQAAPVTFDFASIADTAPGEYGAPSIDFIDGSLTLTATATDVDSGSEIYNAYLDSGNAGLGVCKVLDGNQCSPSSDDNVTEGEVLKLDFNQKITIDDIFFRDGGHGTNFGSSTVDISVDGGAYASYFLANFVVTGLTGSSFYFANNNTDTGNTTDFYIDSLTVSAVPIPAAVFLFAPALLGFMGFRRRAKNLAA